MRGILEMNRNIQPALNTVQVRCSCGHSTEVRSVLATDLSLEVCSACHPAYTGKQKMAVSGGRVDRFNQRFRKKTNTAQSE